jgi:hypothetical protein
VGKKKGPKSPADKVRKLMKAGKVKKKCCRSKSRCKRCPVLALQRVKAKARKAELKAELRKAA